MDIIEQGDSRVRGAYHEMKVTNNSGVYNKQYKRHVCKKTGKCTLCGWHSGENAFPKPDRKRDKVDKYRRKKARQAKRQAAESFFTDVINA